MTEIVSASDLQGSKSLACDLYGAVEMARMQIEMQREITTLRVEKLMLVKQQSTGADRQAAEHLAAELRQARAQIGVLGQDVLRLQKAAETDRTARLRHVDKLAALQRRANRIQVELDQSRTEAVCARRKVQALEKHRKRAERLESRLEEMRNSWSWRIGQRVVRAANLLLEPLWSARRAKVRITSRPGEAV